MAVEIVADLIAEIRGIPAAVDEAKARKRENWPIRANRASELGHSCLRYLTYLRVAWQERALPSIGLQYLFDERRRQEEHAIEDLKEAGYSFVQQQRPYNWARYEITGRIDGMLMLPRHSARPSSVPAEIKNINTWDWEKIDPDAGLQQFVRSDRVWMRKIPTQTVLYLLMENAELAALILRNASDGRPKVLPVPLDLEIGEEALRKAETVNMHVGQGTLPDRIPYDAETCGRCPFFHLCLPDQAARAGLALLDNPEMEAALARRAEMEAAAKEYERLDRQVKDAAKQALGESGEAVVGTDWLLRVKTQARKAYTVPESTFQRVEIQRLGSKPADAEVAS